MTCTPFLGPGPALSSMGAAPVQHARHRKNERANAGEETEEACLPSGPMKPSLILTTRKASDEAREAGEPAQAVELEAANEGKQYMAVAVHGAQG